MAQTSYSVSIGDGSAHCGNVIGSFNNTFYVPDEDAQIMRWLSPLEPNIGHHSVRIDRLDGVGDWLLETGEFREWSGVEGGAEKAILFCSGNPGVGKTYLSSLVIDTLCDRAREGNIAVAGLYCDYLAQEEQTTTNIIGAILKQLVDRGDIPEYLREAFQEAREETGGRRLRLADLMRMLRVAIASLPQVFICLDALDECLPKHLPELLKSLKYIVRECPNMRIFLTGRPHIRESIQRYFSEVVVIPISPNPDDIRNYAEMRLDRDDEPEAMHNDLRVDIVRVMLERMSNMTFLFVSLSIDAILAEVTIYHRIKKLQQMTPGNGLSDAYTATLTRLKAQKVNKSILGLKALMWVLCSERPLRTEELCHALGVEMGSTDLDPKNVPALRTVLASCLGLVTVEASSSTVRLAHPSLQEYLWSHPTLFHNPHSTIAEVCLTYLNFGSVWDLSPNLRSAPSTMPFLEYASCYWGKHARQGVTERVKVLALRLLGKFDQHISSQLLLLRCDRDTFLGPYFDWVGGPRGFTGLHGVSFLGIVEIVAAVLEMKEWDINASDGMGFTAITLAAGSGHEGVVKMLLEREDVSPNKPDSRGQTPLCCAARTGHEGVVKILLEREDISPNKPDAYGQTPLFGAASNGHQRVVEVLLGREDVNPDKPNKNGETPLFGASWGGHEGVVKILLEREDTSPNKPDNRGQTPLCCASWAGHEEVVKILLEREDTSPNKPDNCGQTPLYCAARTGHEGVVKMLLEREDISPNKPDNRGQTPLYCAAWAGHEGVVEMLLGHDDVNPDKPDAYGQTPLFGAASNGHQRVVEVLLGREDVNPDNPNKNGETPLFGASWGGHEGVVKILLEHDDVNPDKPDKLGRTPLWWAAKSGHAGVVALLQP